MGNNNLDFGKTIKAMAEKLKLPVSEIKIGFHYEDGCDCIMSLSVTVWDVEEKGKFYMPDFSVEDAAIELLKRYFNVSDYVYEMIAESHLDGFIVDCYDRKSGVHLYCENEDLRTGLLTDVHVRHEWTDITNNFDVVKYMEIYERIREERYRSDKDRFETERSLDSIVDFNAYLLSASGSKVFSGFMTVAAGAVTDFVKIHMRVDGAIVVYYVTSSATAWSSMPVTAIVEYTKV